MSEQSRPTKSWVMSWVLCHLSKLLVIGIDDLFCSPEIVGTSIVAFSVV